MSNEIDTKHFLSESKFYEGYSRFIEDEGRYEDWNDAVDRVMLMHRDKYKDKKSADLDSLMAFAEKMYKEKRILGAQRALQFGGEQLVRHNARLYNCTSSFVDRPEFFGEAMYWLLCGAGVGFSVLNVHISKLPRIVPRPKQAKIHVIEDSIEGWATSVDVLLSSFFENGGKFPEYLGRKIYFDYTKIRQKGAKISGGFKAPGPDPLRNALNKIENILISVAEQKRNLKPIEAYDIVMHEADAVIAGGVRRSATICLFDPDDSEMTNAKTGNWYETNPQRGRSNNTAYIIRGVTPEETYRKLFNSVKEFGEPGFGFFDNEYQATNPCFEIGMNPYLINELHEKISGWQGCVSFDTKLITRSGLETIGEIVDENREIEIWNGKKWSLVKPILTGTDRKLYRVKFSDGSYLDCTNNHKFLIKNRFKKEFREVTTLELQNILQTEKFSVHTPRANVVYEDNFNDEPNAYDYGFILGDGTVATRGGTYRQPSAEIYEHEFKYNFPINADYISERVNENGVKFRNYYFRNVNNEFAYKLKYSQGLPKEIFSWSRKSIIDFIAGWIDTDGTITQNKSVRVYGREDKIRDLQLLLTKLGINSSVNLMSKAGTVTSYATRKNDVWYVQITNCKDLYTHKGEIKSTEPKGKGLNQIVKSIEELDGLHNSYCFEESELHQGVFGNVLTKQCNLVETNGSLCNTEQDFYDACKGASILATLQAGYTDFKFLTNTTKKIFDREALIGVSLTGWMNNPKVLLNPETLRKGAKLVKDINEQVAKLININPATRTTCVKPSGNASVLLMTASGIHGEHAPRFIRNVQMNKDSEVAKVFAETNPEMIEESVWNANGTDYVISFPFISKEGSKYKKDMLGTKQLEIIKMVQENWVIEGTRPDIAVDPLTRHNVSNTVQVDDWKAVEDYIFENSNIFSGISLLALTGDKDYAQAPVTEVLTDKEILNKYGSAALFASGLIVDGLNAFDNKLWTATSTAQGFGEDLSKESHNVHIKRDWVRRFEKFAENYFSGDLKKTEYCLKDVYLLHKWDRIQRKITPIDFKSVLKKQVYTDIDTMSAQACAGNSCEI